MEEKLIEVLSDENASGVLNYAEGELVSATIKWERLGE